MSEPCGGRRAAGDGRTGTESDDQSPGGAARRTGLFFVSDGMRQDLIERYAAEGAMPAMARLLREGTRGADGVLPPMPTNTGAGWATLLTGAWSGRHGSLNNTFHMPGDPIQVGRRGFSADLLEAETIVQAAERQGLRTLAFEWPSTLPARTQGLVLSYRTFLGARGVVATYPPRGAEAAEPLGRDLFAATVTFHPAVEWTNLDALEPGRSQETSARSTHSSPLPPMACSFVLPTSDAAVNPDRTLHLLACATGNAGYDRLLLAETTDAARPLVTLTAGQWDAARLVLPDGRAASVWLKCVELEPDLSRVRVYFTALSRPQASPAALEERVAGWDLAPPLTADYGPIQAGLIDEATYVEQALLWFDFAVPALERLVREVQPDLLLAGAPVTDEFSHQFMARVTPSYPGYDPDRAEHYESLIRLAYQRTDAFFAHVRALMPEETVTVVSSDHGFAPAWRSVNANLILQRAGLLEFDAVGRPAQSSRAVAYGVGGAANLYLNVQGREPGGVVPADEIVARTDEILSAFRAVRDEAAPEATVIARVLRREETAAVETGEGTANMLHPTRTGDVVVFTAPPYQFDGAQPNRLIAEAPLFGQHGYLADVVDPARNSTMRSAFIAHGPGIRAGHTLEGGRAIDLAPTLAAAMGIDGPADADGTVLVGVFVAERPALTPGPSPAVAGEGSLQQQ